MYNVIVLFRIERDLSILKIFPHNEVHNLNIKYLLLHALMSQSFYFDRI